MPNNKIYDDISLKKFKLLNDILNEPYATWEKVIDKDDILIYKTLKPGSPSVYVKGEAIIYKIKKKVVLRAIVVPEKRPS